MCQFTKQHVEVKVEVKISGVLWTIVNFGHSPDQRKNHYYYERMQSSLFQVQCHYQFLLHMKEKGKAAIIIMHLQADTLLHF